MKIQFEYNNSSLSVVLSTAHHQPPPSLSIPGSQYLTQSPGAPHCQYSLYYRHNIAFYLIFNINLSQWSHRRSEYSFQDCYNLNVVTVHWPRRKLPNVCWLLTRFQIRFIKYLFMECFRRLELNSSRRAGWRVFCWLVKSPSPPVSTPQILLLLQRRQSG